MIEYSPLKYKNLDGEHEAIITEIETVENQFYDSQKDNSTEKVLNITFEWNDADTMEKVTHIQKFVTPLVGGQTLFQQLLDAKDVITDLDGGNFDEQDFIGMKVVIVMGKRTDKQNRSWPTVEKIVAVTPKKKINTPKKVEDDVEEIELPF